MKNEMGGACGTYWETRTVYMLLLGKPEGKRSLGRLTRRWEDNIEMDHKEVGWGAWTGLIWLRTGTGGGILGVL
jgi:hypothetical protein